METTKNTAQKQLKQQTEHRLQQDRFHIQPCSAANKPKTVLNHANSFALMDSRGDIYPSPERSMGMYHRGTRFIHQWVVRIDNKELMLLGHTIKQHNNIHSIDLTNPVLQNGKIPENTVHIFRHQLIREDGFYEKITLINYNETEVSFSLSIYFDADFKDIFEIRGTPRKMPNAAVDKSCQAQNTPIRFDYMGGDNLLRTAIIHYEGLRPIFSSVQEMHIPVSLAPKAQREIQLRVHFQIEQQATTELRFEHAKQAALVARANFNLECAAICSNHDALNSWLNRSYTDLFSMYARVGDYRYIYAGVPWFNTPFGRDGIITAMELLWIQPTIAKNVLAFLAHHQATSFSTKSESEPGKILHEAREGEMAATGEIPFQHYYGSIDSTPLFVMLAGRYYKRTGDLHFIKKIWPSLLAALSWMDTYGDIDQDQLLEYLPKRPDALTNQGWKDSVDSVMHEDGLLATAPIALCEVQAYAYEAKLAAAIIALALGQQVLHQRLSNEAIRLKELFNDIFWDHDLKTYVLALDGQKRPCRVMASNAGHALFTGIAEPVKARRTVSTLMSQELYSEWGIRTLSSQEIKYNPMSYHNGSVWPHDNAMIAMGFARYGYKKEVQQVFNGLFEASTHIDLHRLPELFSGLKKRHGEGPTGYPVACSPQAWAVGSVFLLIEALLGLEIDTPKKTITFHDPVLPCAIGDLKINGLALGDFESDIYIQKKTDGNLEISVYPLPKGWHQLITHHDSYW